MYWMGCQSQLHGLMMGAKVHLLELIAKDAKEAECSGSVAVANKLWKVGVYMCVLTATSLCGHEGFHLDLAGMRTYMTKRTVGTIPVGLNKSTVLTEEVCLKLPHITTTICFLGKFKGKTGVDHHLIMVANATSSGLYPHWWMEKLVKCVNLKGDLMAPLLLPRMDCLHPLLTTTWFSESISKWFRKRPTSSQGTMM